MIRLAYDDPFPPFAFTHQGRAEGAIIDILSDALKKFNLKATFVPSPMKEIENLLNTHKVDGISFYGVNPWRKKIFDFSNRLLSTGGAFFLRSPNPSISDIRKGEGLRVATPMSGPLKNYILRRNPKVNLILVEDYPEALEAVLKDKAEVAALNIHVGIYLIRQLFPGRFTIPDNVFIKMDLATAVLKGKHFNLLRQINEGLRDIKENGTYDKIIEKWLGKN